MIQKISDNLYILRDDLLPFSFGGNKYRIASELLNDCKRQGKTCVIGYGGIHSNFNRVLSFLCASQNLPCFIICPIENSEKINGFNNFLTEYASAKIIFCKKTSVSNAVEQTILTCKKNGLDPYYIFGDKYGNGNEKILLNAHVKAYKEIVNEGLFDYIFLPTGTGMTQSGYIAGKLLSDKRSKIVGISISRKSEKEQEIINQYLNRYFDTDNDYFSEIEVDDNYLFGGYGKTSQEIENTIANTYKKYGIPLDPIYTGKAFYGMMQYINRHKISNKKILFIHTGGAPLFFDYINENKDTSRIVETCEYERFLSFVREIDFRFIPHLSERVCLKEYVKKILDNGNVVSIQQNNNIISAVAFYCNDLSSRTSYITLVGTLSHFEGKGYSTQLLKRALDICKTKGMKWCMLETDIHNTKAISLYSKLGFEIASVGHKVKMRKEL